MRTILAFGLVLIAVQFALNNQVECTIPWLGPYSIENENIGVIVLVTFVLGIITGLALTLPNKINKRVMGKG